MSAATAALLAASGVARAESYDAYDIGGQYGWTDPTSSPTDQPQTIRTQGRCAEGSGSMTFVGPDGTVFDGPKAVPHEWRFEDGYTLRIPAGLPVGNDYTVVVQCADMNRIDIAYGITEAGTEPYRIRYSNSPPPSDYQPPSAPAPVTSTTAAAVTVHEEQPTLAPRPATSPRVRAADDTVDRFLDPPTSTALIAASSAPVEMKAPDTSVVTSHRPKTARHARTSPAGLHDRPWLLWAGFVVPLVLLAAAFARFRRGAENDEL